VLYGRAGLLDVCSVARETATVVTSGNPSRKMTGKSVEG
jgi:hypothetical protein